MITLIKIQNKKGRNVFSWKGDTLFIFIAGEEGREEEREGGEEERGGRGICIKKKSPLPIEGVPVLSSQLWGENAKHTFDKTTLFVGF